MCKAVAILDLFVGYGLIDSEYEGSGGSNIPVEIYIKSSPSSIQAALWPTSGPGNSNKIRCSF